MVLEGILVDLILHMAPKQSNPRVIYGIVGLVYNIPGDFLLYWAFSTFFGWLGPYSSSFTASLQFKFFWAV